MCKKFYDLLKECVEEDGVENVRRSVESVEGPSNEQFFGKENLDQMKKQIMEG